jgi:hypothetical protein
MDVVKLKGDVWLRIRHQVLAHQIDARLLDNKIGLTEKELEKQWQVVGLCPRTSALND